MHRPRPSIHNFNTIRFLRNYGMPHIRGLAEAGDGRLLVLFANKEVRVLELREDELTAESACPHIRFCTEASRH